MKEVVVPRALVALGRGVREALARADGVVDRDGRPPGATVVEVCVSMLVLFCFLYSGPEVNSGHSFWKAESSTGSELSSEVPLYFRLRC